MAQPLERSERQRRHRQWLNRAIALGLGIALGVLLSLSLRLLLRKIDPPLKDSVLVGALGLEILIIGVTTLYIRFNWR